ncbi:hypothetical protein BH20CHL5_BH20CHL5_12100 [soil metagenome]|jgi:hypothetical protein
MTVHSRGEATISIADSTTRGLADAIRGAGLSISTAEFVEMATQTLRRTRQRPPVDPASEVDPETRRLFEAGGMNFAPLGPGQDHAVIDTTLEYAVILADSGTVREVASRIGRTEGRVRQMLRGHELFGIRDDDTWRVPWFQFDGDRPVRGLDRVIGALPGAMHPVAVFRLLTSPSPDLLIQDQPMSPLDWLRSGADPAPIVELAADL